jgi:phosphoglycolate phosphatase
MNGFFDDRAHLTTTVFCDFDGPIVDVSERYYATYRQALNKTARYANRDGKESPKIKPLDKWEFWDLKRERTLDRDIALASGLEERSIDYFRECVLEIVNAPQMLELDKIQPGVNWALNFLCSQGIKIVLVTLRRPEQVHHILERYNLSRLFVGVYGTQSDAAAYQNYTDIKTRLLNQAVSEHLFPDNRRQQAWMVGDTEADIVAGKAIDVPTIGLTCGIRSHRQLRQLNPSLIQPDLLSTAHYLIAVNSPTIEGVSC